MITRNKNGTFKKGVLQGRPFQKGNKLRVGMKHTEITKQKISDKKTGIPSGRLGIKHTEKTIEKIRTTKILNTPRGKESHKWKGGISKIDKIIRRLHEYFIWRTAIFERDKWTCQTCGIRGVYVTVHHIKSFALILKENKIINSVMARECAELWDILNGVTLCEDCHALTDNYRGKHNRK